MIEEGGEYMRTIIASMVAFALALFVTVTVTHAQTATPYPSATGTNVQTTPSTPGAPNTGFGK